jgi:hypothetical protein
MTKKIKEPYSLDFVNKGKPFSIPNWTTYKHESVLAKLAADLKDVPEKEQDKEFKHYVIHETLSEIDETGECTLEEIRIMHPVDLIDMFNAVYNAGRKGIYSKDFRKELEKALKPKELKSTGKKS